MSCQFEPARPWESVAAETRAALTVSAQCGGVSMTLHDAGIWLTPEEARKLAQELLLLEAEARGVPVRQ